MYGYEGTQCKIENCTNPVWPNKTLGFCNKHYIRHKTGRMLADGTLKKHIPVGTCEECGKIFTGKHKQNNLKVCPACRPGRYNRTKILNSIGIHRKRTDPSAIHKMKYVRRVLTTIINDCKYIDRYKQVVEMRSNGATYNEIAVHFGVSPQRIQQICAKYYRYLYEEHE